jgi:hypothetical protein
MAKSEQEQIDDAFREYQIECKLLAINLLNKLEKIRHG